MNLLCKIIEKKGDKVLVEIEGQTLTLKVKYFTDDLHLGEQFQIYFWDTKNKFNNNDLAQVILEEILNGK